MADPAPDRFTALPWIIWVAVTAVVVTSTSNAVVLLCVALGCWVTMWSIGGSRAGLMRAAAGASFVLVALWALLGILIHRESLGGQVVWFLPSWTPDSGGELGGAVTVGQLHFAAARASQAIAIVAMLALAFVAVPSTGWLRLADATWGRAGRIWGPVLCLPDAVVDQQREALLVRRFGLAGASGRTSLVDTVDRARELSDRWHAARSSSGRPRALRGLLGLVVLVAAALWWAVSSIDPATRLDVTGTERTLLALAAFGLVAVMLRRSGVPRPTPGDVVPLVGALAMAAAWFGRDLTGEAADLVVDFAALPPLPLAVLAAAAVLPIVAAAAGGSR